MENRRRHCYPSWSPIGWTGGAEWISSRYIPTYATLVRLDGIQALIDGHEYQDLSTIIAKKEYSAPDRLKLENDALELKVVRGFGVGCELAPSIDEDKDLIFFAEWSIPLEERSPGQLLYAIVLDQFCIEQRYDVASFSNIRAIVVAPHCDHYERVAILKLPEIVSVRGRYITTAGVSLHISGKQHAFACFVRKSAFKLYAYIAKACGGNTGTGEQYCVVRLGLGQIGWWKKYLSKKRIFILG